MAFRDEAITTGTEKQGDMRKRTAGQAPQANGAYTPKDVQEKTKEKVCFPGGTTVVERDDGLTAGFCSFRQALLSTSWTSTSI
jgi:hypothetical protein